MAADLPPVCDPTKRYGDHSDPEELSALERGLPGSNRPKRNPARNPGLWQGVLETLDRIPCPKPDRGEDAVPQGFR